MHLLINESKSTYTYSFSQAVAGDTMEITSGKCLFTCSTVGSLSSYRDSEINLGLVRSIAIKFRDRGVEYDDLIQIGCIGMLKAIRSFDFEKGTAFSTSSHPQSPKKQESTSKTANNRFI